VSEELANEQESDAIGEGTAAAGQTEDVEIVEGVEADAVVEGEVVDEEAPQEPSLEEQLAAAQDEAARHLDSYLRAQAELANARKRFEKQRALAYVSANADLVSKLLPVLDDYERALDTVPEAVKDDPWYAGIELVYRKLLGVLENMNVVEIEAVGQAFDPHFHEALAQEPSDEVESGMVTRVMQKGYQIGDRVVRPSLVYVAE
jgi:molecular chaperone GrpE